MAKELPGASGEVQVVLLDGGGFTTTDDTKIHADGHSRPYYLYDWCFYLYHKPTGSRVLWDLGISNDRELYTPFVLNFHWPSCNPVGPRRSLVNQLADLGVASEQIDTVIFSHAHWDHCRPIKSEFPNAKVLFGPGTGSHCSPGHIRDGKVQPMVQWDSRFFGTSDVCTDPYEELKGPWKPWGPFEQALDYFGDGSFWILQAPGHMKGNLAACVRLKSGEWVLLASDCCHSKEIFDGVKQIANVSMPDGSMFCLHESLGAALDTIGKLRMAVRDYGMHIAMAHDAEFIKEGKDSTLMSLLHPLFDEECLARIRAHQQP
ncbi:Lactamase-B domain-containing protein [Fusarium falciforme]|uniref:Lactamase-B domain-containing protein n=1 Tax=Fusarium falciforme TaxID=195108 RepID=UPI002301722E|nr:Lactamase-B domain-containing protein [Fusarium falciforme]WAO95250.1 Lactamase-B domain-containing protein [Fusarium falciforme]